MANDNPNVLSQEIFNDTVTLVGGKVYTSEIIDFGPEGFNVRVSQNDPSGDITAVLTLESWDKDQGWIPENRAVFDNPPNGTTRKSTDTFKTTHADKYKVGIDPTGGTTGAFQVSYSRNKGA